MQKQFSRESRALTDADTLQQAIRQLLEQISKRDEKIAEAQRLKNHQEEKISSLQQSAQNLNVQVATITAHAEGLAAQIAQKGQIIVQQEYELAAQIAQKDQIIVQQEYELAAQIAQKDQIIVQQEVLLNKVNQEKILFHNALGAIVNSRAWKMILVLQKIRRWLLPENSFQPRAVRYMLVVVRRVAGKFRSAALFLNKSFHYVRKNGVKESFLTIKYRAKQEHPTIKLESSVHIPLQKILNHLSIPLESEQVVSAFMEIFGQEKTSRVLADMVQVENFLFAKNKQPSYPLVYASQLPAALAHTARRKILFITAEFPSSHHGGGNRVLNFIKTLEPTNDIYLCAAYSPEEHEQSLSALAPYCQKILKIPYGRFGGNQDQIRNWIGSTVMDIVHYEWPRSVENYDASFGKVQIFTFMEAVSLRLLMDMERLIPLSAGWVEKLGQLAYALRLEFPQASATNARIAVTTKDAEFFRNLYPYQKYVILNHGLSFEEFTLPEVSPEPNTLVFVGNYLHYPNAEALEFFFNEIWKNIRNEIPDVRIYVVGTNPTDNIMRMADDQHIIVTGTVEDVRPYIQKAAVCIAPLISGAGLRGKVIEYAALRRPFVATSIASTDLVFKNGIDYYCADTALEFADKVIALLKSPQLADQMADCAYETARQNYDNQRLTGFLLSLYDYLEKDSQ